MVQTKRKTNVVALAIVLSLMLVFAMAVALFAMPATDTAHALDDVAQFHFYGISGTGSKTDGGITFSYSGSYFISPGTSCIVLEAGGSFTLTVSESALNNKNITKVKYTLTQDYVSGDGNGDISVSLKRGKRSTSSTSTSGYDISSGSGNLTFTIRNKSTADRSKAYNGPLPSRCYGKCRYGRQRSVLVLCAKRQSCRCKREQVCREYDRVCVCQISQRLPSPIRMGFGVG